MIFHINAALDYSIVLIQTIEKPCERANFDLTPRRKDEKENFYKHNFLFIFSLNRRKSMTKWLFLIIFRSLLHHLMAQSGTIMSLLVFLSDWWLSSCSPESLLIFFVAIVHITFYKKKKTIFEWLGTWNFWSKSLTFDHWDYLIWTNFRAFAQQNRFTREIWYRICAENRCARKLIRAKCFISKILFCRLFVFVCFLSICNTNMLYLVLFFLRKFPNINETLIKTYFLKIFWPI